MRSSSASRAAPPKARAVTIAALAPFPSAPVAPPVEDDFARLYRQYRPQLLRYITHHFGPRDADEITQEALTRALRAMDRNRSEGETWAWLVRVARNVAHDMARSRRICESTDDAAVLAKDVADDTSLPEPAALLNERRHLVRRALRMLPPSQRRILVLYEVDELNCPAIAGLVGSTEDAVRKALQRARRRFAAEVRALGGGTAGSFAFWLGALRRRAVKAVPAASASTTALCAIIGSVAVTVSVQPARPVQLSPSYASPMAAASASASEARQAVTRASVLRMPAASAARADAVRPTTPGEPAVAKPLGAVTVKMPVSPGSEPIDNHITVPTPLGPLDLDTEYVPSDEAGLVCSFVTCE